MRLDEPATVTLTVTGVNDLVRFFEQEHVYSVPVVDTEGLLVGLLRRAAVEKAVAEHSEEDDRASLAVAPPPTLPCSHDAMDLLQDHPVLLSATIFFARVLDVSIGTVRTILILRGYRAEGSLLGFLEILVWVTAAAQVITNLEAWYLAVAYAGGFGAGNYVGSWLESRLALGAEIVRVIAKDPRVRLKEELTRAGFDAVELEGLGADGASVEILFVVESRRRVRRLLELVRATDPAAVCSISDVRIPANRLPRTAGSPAPRGGWRSRTKR